MHLKHTSEQNKADCVQSVQYITEQESGFSPSAAVSSVVFFFFFWRGENEIDILQGHTEEARRQRNFKQLSNVRFSKYMPWPNKTFANSNNVVIIAKPATRH